MRPGVTYERQSWGSAIMNSGLPGASVHEQLRRRAGGSRNVHLVAAIRSSRPPGGPPYYAGMEPIVLRPGGGRTYEMGRITATFKVDVPRCTISEWWLEPDTAGPGPHSHPDDDVFYVLSLIGSPTAIASIWEIPKVSAPETEGNAKTRAACK